MLSRRFSSAVTYLTSSVRRDLLFTVVYTRTPLSLHASGYDTESEEGHDSGADHDVAHLGGCSVQAFTVAGDTVRTTTSQLLRPIA